MDDANLHVYEVLGAPFPYLVVETKMSPDWPKEGGTGPVVPPTPLHKPITHFGTKGIEVIGRGFSQKLDYPKV